MCLSEKSPSPSQFVTVWTSHTPQRLRPFSRTVSLTMYRIGAGSRLGMARRPSVPDFPSKVALTDTPQNTTPRRI